MTFQRHSLQQRLLHPYFPNRGLLFKHAVCIIWCNSPNTNTKCASIPLYTPTLAFKICITITLVHITDAHTTSCFFFTTRQNQYQELQHFLSSQQSGKGCGPHQPWSHGTRLVAYLFYKILMKRCFAISEGHSFKRFC